MTRADVPLPRRMKALPRDPRGYPVPFVVLRDLDGKPHFTINDTRRVLRVIAEGRCGICGGRIRREPFWFAGGPGSAFHEYGVYSDTPMHHDCMTYALQVCPYLALHSYAGRIDDATVDYDRIDRPEGYAGPLFIDPTMDPKRPAYFVAVATTDYKVRQGDRPELVYIRPERPYLAVEYWQDGRRIAEPDQHRTVLT